MLKIFRHNVAVLLAAAAGAALAQDPTAGQAAFAQCAACHSVDGSLGTGPSLRGIAGRKAGSVEGFRYSRALKNAGYVWDARSLDAFIAEPQKALAGTLMPFAGVPDAQQRADLVAFLLTLH
ncbi:c-type cytochrome [Ramlibacter sp.]|uniref:c-type cytochrome n=1 Tax=Ramlibacter sp. TaxID=1917967 RepID=UPI00261F85D7|nr:c-type cytochrome [Ramlibacter sp.]MDB5955223.1 cytochrome c family protein [Ramlibacter sp.]